MTDYRIDSRTTGQFKKDMKIGHQKEAEIAIRLAIAIHAKTKKWPSVKPAGIDMTGEFIEDIKDVTSEPDFLIDDKLVEITRADVVCNRSFHQKTYKIDRCLREGTDLVFVNGFGVNKQPDFVWFGAEDWQFFVTKAITKYGKVQHPGNRGIRSTGKPAYRFDTYWFKDYWKPLPALIKKGLPKEYEEVLNLAKV
jgi:hypothetical protein